MSFSSPGTRQSQAERTPRHVAASIDRGSSTATAIPRCPRHGDTARASAVARRDDFLLRARIGPLLDWTVYAGLFALLLLVAPGLDYFLSSQDHGYQLAVATQILLGKVPGIDVISGYGPAVMYTSALGLWASGSLVGETVLCAGGYALALFVIYRLVSAHSSRWAGLASAALAFVLLARFYKWYVWLIPLSTLWALSRYLSSPADRRRRWIGVCGLVVGLGWLYRLDMGTLELAAGLITVALAEVCWRQESGNVVPRIMRAAPRLLLLVATFSVPPLLWLGYLAIRVGRPAPLEFFATTIAGALAVAKGMAQPLPANGAVVWAYLLAPVLLFTTAGVALSREIAGRGEPCSRFLLAAALVGLAAAHQAMHRMGPAHLLQVIPPAIVCTFVSFAGFRRWFAKLSLRRAMTWAIGLAGIMYFSLLAIGAIGLAPWGRQDLVALSSSLRQRYWDLARPRLTADRHPAVGVIEFIREQTGPRDPILVFPFDCQLYTFAERRLSGRLHGYYAGVFDDPQSQQQNLAAIRREMPTLVVLPSDRKRPAATDATAELIARSRKTHRYVEEFLRARYTRVEYDDGEFLVLGRPG